MVGYGCRIWVQSGPRCSTEGKYRDVTEWVAPSGFCPIESGYYQTHEAVPPQPFARFLGYREALQTTSENEPWGRVREIPLTFSTSMAEKMS